MPIPTNYGSVVVDTSLVPYIRERDVDFVARNLRPYKTAYTYFDEVAVNGYSQVANKIIVDAKKVVSISPNNTGNIVASSVAWQGSSNTVNTFNAIVDAWYVSNSTVVLKTISGNFDESANLHFEYFSNGNNYIYGTVTSVKNYQTSDVFMRDDGIIDPSAGNSYARVIASSGENVLYIDQNYININVSAVGLNSLSTMSSDYHDGDLVYQTVDGTQSYSNTNVVFKGYVKYYHTTNTADPCFATLAISPITGSLNANSTSANSNSTVRIWNATNRTAKPLAANAFIIGAFAPGHNVASVDMGTSVKIISYTHSSGILSNTNTPDTQTIILNANTSTEAAIGKYVYFTTGTGSGIIRTILAVSGEAATLNSAIDFAYESNTHYSIGNLQVDDHGTTAGIFHIPENSVAKFKTGERLFTITDTGTYNDPDYAMRATHRYSASAILNTKQNIQMTPTVNPLPETEADSPVVPIDPSQRTFNSDASKNPVTGSFSLSIPRIPLGDGMAQTFFTPKPASNKQDYGMFVSSIDLFFKDKPSVASGSMQLPITVKIAEVTNGYPTKNYLAAKTIQTKDVKITDLPNAANSSTVAATGTKFMFDDPVYLQPNHEYAIIISSDSPDYTVYTAVIGEDVLGSNPTRRISEQPYAGSFFRSQNSSTWTAYQNEDLMFIINKAVFSSSGTATFNMEEAPVGYMLVDKVSLVSSDLGFPNANLAYKLKGTYFKDKTQETVGNPIVPNTTLEYGSLLDKSNKTGSNRRIIRPGNSNSSILTVEMFTSDTDISPILNTERLALKFFQYNINNAILSNTDIAITNFGAGYNACATSGNVVKGATGASGDTLNTHAQFYRETYLANDYNVGFYNITITGGNGSGAAGFAVANTDGSNTINYIVLTESGSGYIETPTISIASGNAATNVQAYATINGETDKSGGNITSKYITREIILEDGFDSGDLDVFMDATRVTGTDIQVYYKVVSADDPDRLDAKSWRRMEKEKEVFSKDYNTKVSLHFKPSFLTNQISYVENGINYPINHMFKSFAIKVCLTSTDGAVVPKLDNLRIQATPAG